MCWDLSICLSSDLPHLLSRKPKKEAATSALGAEFLAPGQKEMSLRELSFHSVAAKS